MHLNRFEARRHGRKTMLLLVLNINSGTHRGKREDVTKRRAAGHEYSTEQSYPPPMISPPVTTRYRRWRDPTAALASAAIASSCSASQDSGRCKASIENRMSSSTSSGEMTRHWKMESIS